MNIFLLWTQRRQAFIAVMRERPDLARKGKSLIGHLVECPLLVSGSFMIKSQIAVNVHLTLLLHKANRGILQYLASNYANVYMVMRTEKEYSEYSVIIIPIKEVKTTVKKVKRNRPKDNNRQVSKKKFELLLKS